MDPIAESNESEVSQRVHLNSNPLSTEQKIQYNIESIRVLKSIQKENRKASASKKMSYWI